jgi:hypothetical protein
MTKSDFRCSNLSVLPAAPCFDEASSVALPDTVKLPQVVTTHWGSGSLLQRLDCSIVSPIFLVNQKKRVSAMCAGVSLTITPLFSLWVDLKQKRLNVELGIFESIFATYDDSDSYNAKELGYGLDKGSRFWLQHITTDP